MNEVSGPVIAVALVLCAVFVPTAFVSGITGQFYRQFALTIAVSTVISAFNSLTLSPALERHSAEAAITRRRIGSPRVMDRVLGWFFRLFNKGFDRTTNGYTRAVGGTVRRGGIALAVYAGLLAADMVRFQSRADRFHSAAGLGLSDRLRATARRREPGAQPEDHHARPAKSRARFPA